MTNQVKISAIVAYASSSRGIGKNGLLPWRLKKDMKYFKTITSTTQNASKRNAVIMGRKTWVSIPKKFRPLPDRLNVVLSRNPAQLRMEEHVPLEVPILTSFNEAIVALSRESNIETIFVIGGESIYREALAHGLDEIHATVVDGEFDCDAFFPVLPEGEYEDVTEDETAIQEEDATYTFRLFKNKNALSQPGEDPVAASADSGEQATSPTNSSVARRDDTLENLSVAASAAHEEYQYLNLVREILQHGVDKGDRTGTGTRSVFGRTMRFSLRDGTLPLLTTKRVFWRGVAEELLWFVSGDTSAKTLQDKNIHIWDGNGSREYLDRIGLTDREEGDLGPVYGFQWRHFGAEYKTMHDDYAGQGVDQLANLVEKIKTNPNDRRLIVSAWNPAAFHLMALPPCHMFAQFYVANGELSCQMYQRSADMGLGVPFNIASYALLTHMIAQCTGLKAGDFVHVIGDCHVYRNHIEPLQEQLRRTPTAFPKLKINTENKDIDGFKYSDFEVVGYKPQKTIKMDMSV